MSENIDNFLAFTSTTDRNTAEQYLTVSNNDIDAAITLFFENDGRPLTSTTNNENSNIGEDEDAALAAQLQNEAYNENEVRAPIQSTRETLLGDYGSSYSYPTRQAPLPPMNSIFDQNPLNRARGAFNQIGNPISSRNHRVAIYDDDDNDDNVDEEDTDIDVSSEGDNDDLDDEEDEYAGMTATQARLARIFRPPYDLITSVSVPRARNIAKQQKKWVMVNLQDTTDFNCQILNRDFWSDPQIKVIVKENFIFLQFQKGNQDADTSSYENFYPVTKFPHISIIDPLTGERLKIWNKVPEVNEFMEDVFEFLSRFSLEKGSYNPVVTYKSRVNVDAMTEEEQLQHAVAKSLNPVEEDSDEEINITESRAGPSNRPILSDSKGASASQPINLSASEDEDMEEEEPEKDLFLSILPVDHAEPKNDPKTTTRVQIRMGDGSRIVRRVSLTDTVRSIYETIKQLVPQVKDQYFVLTSERKKLIDMLDRSVEDAGLKNSVILVEVVS